MYVQNPYISKKINHYNCDKIICYIKEKQGVWLKIKHHHIMTFYTAG